MSRRALFQYTIFFVFLACVVLLAAIPIFASDIFREPYSPAWPFIDRLMARLRINPFPVGGGAPPRFPYWRDPADAGMYYRDLTLVTSDGVRIAAWYVPAIQDPGSGPAPTVVLCHGLYDNKSTMLGLVPWLHDAGYNVMLFDFRGQGDSEKRPTTVGPKEALDLEAALDWLEAEGAGGWIGGLGMSLGAAALVNAAAQDARLDALVLDSLFADWEDTDFAKGFRLPPDWLVPGVPSPETLMPSIHVPVFLIQGTADILIKVDHGYRLYEAANEPKALWINNSGHAWSSWTYPLVYRHKVLDFLAAAQEREKALP
jgi:alpha-beta hydrolase superfamily lysophospholipase